MIKISNGVDAMPTRKQLERALREIDEAIEEGWFHLEESGMPPLQTDFDAKSMSRAGLNKLCDVAVMQLQLLRMHASYREKLHPDPEKLASDVVSSLGAMTKLRRRQRRERKAASTTKSTDGASADESHPRL